MRVWPGKPFPLGPLWDGQGTNFSLFSSLIDAMFSRTRSMIASPTASAVAAVLRRGRPFSS